MKLRRDCMGTVLLQAQNLIIAGPREQETEGRRQKTGDRSNPGSAKESAAGPLFEAASLRRGLQNEANLGLSERLFCRLAGIGERERHMAVPEWKLLIPT